MNNLFSIFDPISSFINFNLNWISRLCILIFIPSSFWLIKRKIRQIFILILDYLNKEFLLALTFVKTPGLSHLFISIFLFIALNNFLGLFPYIFTSSSHLTLYPWISAPRSKSRRKWRPASCTVISNKTISTSCGHLANQHPHLSKILPFNMMRPRQKPQLHSNTRKLLVYHLLRIKPRQKPMHQPHRWLGNQEKKEKQPHKTWWSLLLAKRSRPQASIPSPQSGSASRTTST